MADNSTDPNFPPPSLPPPEPAPPAESAAPPTPRVDIDPSTLAPSDADIGGDTIDGLLGDLAHERRPGYLAKGQIRETAGHIAAAYNTPGAMFPQTPRTTEPPEAPVVLSDSLLMSRDLVPKAPPTPEMEAVTQPIPKDVVADSVRGVATGGVEGMPPPTVPRRRVEADVGGETVMVPRASARGSIGDRRQRMKWIVAAGTVALGMFALVVFLVNLPNSSSAAPIPPMPTAVAPPSTAAGEAPVIPPPPEETAAPTPTTPPPVVTAAPATPATTHTPVAPRPRPRQPTQPTGPKDDVKRTL